MYRQLFPGKPDGFIAVDSAPLQKKYYNGIEIRMLKNMRTLYGLYSWKRLLKDGPEGGAETAYGRDLMRSMMLPYGKDAYTELTGHGYRILADAIEVDLPYEIRCPALLICGRKDKAGLTRKYNEKWSAETGFPIVWIEGAGHNSNTDRPDEVNRRIMDFVLGLRDGRKKHQTADE